MSRRSLRALHLLIHAHFSAGSRRVLAWGSVASSLLQLVVAPFAQGASPHPTDTASYIAATGGVAETLTDWG